MSIKNKAAKINHVLLQQQLPDDIRVARSSSNKNITSTASNKSGASTTSSGSSTAGISSASTPRTSSTPSYSGSTRVVRAVDHVSQLALETCRCTHIQEYLPHILDMELCRAVHHPRGWVVANPVHSLHLASSQLEDTTPALTHMKQPPILYGEEQQRTNALRTEGVVEYWCPLDGYSAVIHDDTALEKMEHMPTLHSIHPAQLSQTKPSPTTWTKSPTPKKPRLYQQQQQQPNKKEKQNTIEGQQVGTSKASPNDSPASSSPTKQEEISPKGDQATTKNSSANVESTLPSNDGPTTSVAAPAASMSTSVLPVSPNRNDLEDTKMETSPATNTTETSKKAYDKVDTVSTEINPEDPTTASIQSSTAGLPLDVTVKPLGPSDDKLRSDEESSQAEENMIATNNSAEEKKARISSGSSVKNDGLHHDEDTTEWLESLNEKKIIENEARKEAALPPPRDSSIDKDDVETKESLQLAKLKENEDKKIKTDRIHPETVTGSSNADKSEPPPNVACLDVPATDEKDKVISNEIDGLKKATGKGTNECVYSEKLKKDKVTDNHEKEKDGEKIDGDVISQEEVRSNNFVKEEDKELAASIPIIPSSAEHDTSGTTTLPTNKKFADKSLEDDKVEKTSSSSNIQAGKIDGTTTNFVTGISPSVKKADATGELVETSSLPIQKEGKPSTNSSASAVDLVKSYDETKSEAAVPFPLEDDPYIDHLRLEEDRIRLIRRSLALKRTRKKSESKETSTKKKRKRDSDIYKANGIPGWRASAPKELSSLQEREWMEAVHKANETVERWMNNFRTSQESYWLKKRREYQRTPQKQSKSFFWEPEIDHEDQRCNWCTLEDRKRSRRQTTKKRRKESRLYAGDELMQCLECSFVGCSPPSFCPDSRQHILHHLLISGHNFAVSCGEKAQVFCFKCGDFIYHEIFEQERLRISCAKRLPHMAWKDHAVLRSFDAFQFLKTQDHGIVWRGLIATYPPMVPRQHFCAAELTLRRQALFEGRIHERWMLPKANALDFAASQFLKRTEERCRILAPVGMYNHGNTCYMSAILQCLVFCDPLQQYFLQGIGHHHKACLLYCREEDNRASPQKVKSANSKTKKGGNASTAKSRTSKTVPQICLACEMDRLFLSYFGSTIGREVPIEESSRHLLLESSIDTRQKDSLRGNVIIGKGDPLVISEMITSAWKSGHMDHLAGYDQRDAHEFLNSFLELLGRHIVRFRERIYSSIITVDDSNAIVSKPEKKDIVADIVNQLFQGYLRSVLLCETCGVKRVHSESFVNISLSLSEEVERMQRGKGIRNFDISVQTCLEHFVLPEKLGDLVYCPSCSRKTETKKQHTFARLPKVLCLHLKRFDAAHNKKIEHFVSFPARGLNMGSLLSHWCEVSSLESSSYEPEEVPTAEPKILYDLFGTANHIGSMQSGHYVANVKVDNTWYHCNDQHISHATEESVMKADGAYVLFYIRR